MPLFVFGSGFVVRIVRVSSQEILVIALLRLEKQSAIGGTDVGKVYMKSVKCKSKSVKYYA